LEWDGTAWDEQPGPGPRSSSFASLLCSGGRKRGGPSGSVWPTRSVRLGGGGRAGKTLPRGWEGRMVILEPGSKSFLGVWFFLLCLDDVRRLVWPGGCASACGEKRSPIFFLQGQVPEEKGDVSIPRRLGRGSVGLGWAWGDPHDRTRDWDWHWEPPARSGSVDCRRRAA